MARLHSLVPKFEMKSGEVECQVSYIIIMHAGICIANSLLLL